MKYFPIIVMTLFLSIKASGESWDSDIRSLIESSCIDCHDANTETELNLEQLGSDLNDQASFAKWVKVFDRVEAGDMPPESEARPDEKIVSSSLNALKNQLQKTSRQSQRREGRVPARRLTKLEFGYTLQDLLLIDKDVSAELPAENESGSFDTVGESQRFSAVHMEAYLEAVDEALDHAIRLGRNPSRRFEFDFMNSAFLNSFHEKPLELGGNVTLKMDDGIALFADVDYLFRSDAHGFSIVAPGFYRIRSKVAAYQSDRPVTLKMIARNQSGAARLIQSHDLNPGEPELIETTAFLEPGDSFYPTFDTEMTAGQVYGAIAAAGGAKNYKGRGIAIVEQNVEGPIFPDWPPPSTRRLLDGIELTPTDRSGRGGFQAELSKPPMTEISAVVSEFALLVFRRPGREGELAPFVELAKPAIDDGRGFTAALRIPIRAMFTSPQFLMFDDQPGELDDHALACRLSYFLWKSLPDEALRLLADQGKLSDRDILKQQVDRMLDDEKAIRFVRDFLGQWMRLSKLNVTSPDETLYPEFDELLAASIAEEPELFFRELIRKNLSVTHLVTADFTFVNRRLAKHYGLEGIKGQHFRRVDLPTASPRGGMLTQAAIMKTTANGTVTSPVTRGNFVLTNLLGTPPSPPPPSVGSIEPDTRGQTTIREILAAHRDIESCARCHREIDPPGFALECFDPIGGYRTHYRANKNGLAGLFSKTSYQVGPVVNASGRTSDGKHFSGIAEFKELLLEQTDQIAKNFVSNLVVYSTGGEIQFADRDGIDQILDQTRANDFSVRDIIHEVVQSRLFRHL